MVVFLLKSPNIYLKAGYFGMSCHFLLLATVETYTTNTLLWKKANSYMSENISQIKFQL